MSSGIARSQAIQVYSRLVATTDVHLGRSRSPTADPPQAARNQEGRDLLFVWLWEATGDSGLACGVSDDQADAQEAAGACIASGKAATAVVQLAKLVDDPDTLDPHYVRFGSRWQASRTRAGAIRWRESAAHPAS